MLHSYGMNYEEGERYEELASPRGPGCSGGYSQDIMRSLEELELNRIDGCRRYGGPSRRPQERLRRGRRDPEEEEEEEESCLSASWPGGRPYYATLPRRGRAYYNFEEQFLPQDLQRLSKYPKSLQDLKYLEIEAILGRDPRPAGPSSDDRRLPRRERLNPLIEGRARGGDRGEASGRRAVGAAGGRESRMLAESLAGGSQIERYEPGKVHYEREYRIYGKDTVALIFYKTCYL